MYQGDLSSTRPTTASCTERDLPPTLIVSRSLHDDPGRRAVEDDLARLAAEAGLDVLVMPHIYHLPHESEAWGAIAALTGPVAVAAWLHPRPAEWVLRSHGLVGEEFLALDLGDTSSAAEVMAGLAGWAGDVGPGAGAVRVIAEPTGERWYPVPDRSRCTGCGHCVQFCIFGVWATDEDGLAVAVAPDNCKDGCPACARICPRGAIIFPLCDEPAIAGAPGTTVSPDVEARRMYYTRTGAACPVCGCSGEAQRAESGGPRCEECGRPLQAGADPERSAVSDEIDALIEELDDLLGEGQR